MALNTLDFVSLVRQQAQYIQGAARNMIDFTIGSVLRAMVEANAGVVLWLQGLILQLLATTRAATSSGADLDSFVEDFGMTRLPAVAASGSVTFSRFTPTNSAFIPVGTQVQTSDQTPETFTVGIDTTNAYYSAALGGYTIPANIASATVPVTAAVAGSGGNVLAGQCNVLTQSIPYVDTVTNAGALTNGQDEETDAALRIRFVAFMFSLAKATKGAIGAAILAVQAGLTYSLVENYDYSGAIDNGYFYAIVDDGSGNPSSALISTISNAIDAVRPCCSRFGVFGPTIVDASVVMTLTTATGYAHSDLVAQVVAALTSYINSLALGQTLPYTKLAQIAYDVSAGITDVTGITLNGSNVDLAATPQQIIKALTITVN